MKLIIEKLIDLLMRITPFLGKRRKTAEELREFSDLITGQYDFLVTQLGRVLKDYFEISDKVREMHTELFRLKEQLAKSAARQCRNTECKERK